MNQVVTFTVENYITNQILSSFNKYKHNKSNLIDTSICNTNKGIQTDNALDLKDFREDKKFEKCLDYLLNLLHRESGQSYLSFNWVHFVEYQRGGYQELHDHKESETFSSILYLNTCRGGETFFPNSTGLRHGDRLTISPIKNKMIVFPSYFSHKANKTSSWFINKKVMVMGIR